MTTRHNIIKSGKLIILVVGFFWLVFVIRAAHVQIIDHQKYADYAQEQQSSTMPLSAKRGTIFDCDGRALAYDIEASSFTINPRYMKHPAQMAARLTSITGKPTSYWFRQFEKYPGFLMVARRVTPEMKKLFDDSGIETLRSRGESIRVYPYADIASEVIGRTDADNVGASGLEKYYNSLLSGRDGKSIYLRDAYGREVTAWEHTIEPPTDGSDIYLALDMNLQEILESELQTMLDSSSALWGTAVFLDAETGGILASGTAEATRPQFKRCRAIVDMNEPGSTAKIVPLSTVFDARLFEPTDIVNVENGRFKVGGHLIRDDHPHSLLQCSEIGIYSSNIGAAKLGLAAGPDLIYKTLMQLGFGTKTLVDFPGESPGTVYKPSTWSKHMLATICFGYGMAASALQIACAYGVVASGGELLKPFFASRAVSPDSSEKILNSKSVVRKVWDDRTISILNDIFKNVVQVGTATKAIDDQCPIAGKTGTALRRNAATKQYESRKALASFTGYFPADSPKIVGIVMFDQPRTSIYGGEVSAPVFKNIAKRYGAIPGNDLFINSTKKPKDSRAMMVGGNDNAGVLHADIKRPLKKPAEKKQPPRTGGFPDFTGKTMRDAIRVVKERGMECTITGSGVVVSQVPEPGADTTGIQTVELIGETR